MGSGDCEDSALQLFSAWCGISLSHRDAMQRLAVTTRGLSLPTKLLLAIRCHFFSNSKKASLQVLFISLVSVTNPIHSMKQISSREFISRSADQ
jgi:hypothetical protein